jgi:hypothetical protein
MKALFFSIALFLIFSATGQSKKMDVSFLKSKEDSLSLIGPEIINATEASKRFKADSQFTRILVRALRSSYSFYFPFDSLKSISRIYAPDSSFRIFTWQVSRDEDLHRRHGAIQMNTTDGSLKLFPLIERSNLISQQEDTITNNEWWIAAIYYKMLLNSYNGKKYYTLLGYDEHSIRSTMKRIEVLTFDKEGKPVFGEKIFDFGLDSIPQKNQTRYWIEYKKNANARMQYDEDLKMIIYDHLISETNEPSKKYTYIPDGDYEGFKWENGKWRHIEKVFTYKLQDGQAPVVVPKTEGKLKPVKKG